MNLKKHKKNVLDQENKKHDNNNITKRKQRSLSVPEIESETTGTAF